MTEARPTFWAAFRQWRRTRPFWGGVLAVLAGVEILLLPLAPLSLSITMGIAGIAPWLVAVLMVAVGVLTCTQPAQRSFYGILTVLLSLVSFIACSFGGLLVGMLLGLVAGGLIFAWSPATRPPLSRATLVDLSDDAPTTVIAVAPPSATGRRRSAAARGRRARTAGGGHAKAARTALAVAVLPTALGGTLLAGPQARAATTAPEPTTSATPAATPSASTTPSATPSPSPSASSSPSPSAESAKDSTTPKADSGTASACALPTPAAGESAQQQARDLLTNARQLLADCPAGSLGDATTSAKSTGIPTFSSGTAALTADSFTMYGSTYDGVVTLHTGKGSVQALRFSMDKAVLTNVDQHAGSYAQSIPTLTFTGHVVTYATKLSGSLLGIPLTLEAGSALLPVLTALNALHLPVLSLTGVSSTQPAVTADTTTATPLHVRNQ